MRLHRQPKTAFTLLELLVVIAIIAVVAGLVVGLNTVASEKKKLSRAQVERDRLVTLIEAYKTKLGVYPPDNRKIPFNPAFNSLFYELAGAVRLPGGVYSNAFETVRGTDLNSAFGIDGMLNASDDPTEIKRILKTVKPDQIASIAGNTKSFVVPIDGPKDWLGMPNVNGTPNPWRYAVGTNAVHNPESFDLWVEIVFRNKTNIIGNWKD